MRNSQLWFAGGFIILTTAILLTGRMGGTLEPSEEHEHLRKLPVGPPPVGSQQTTMGAGCFWCTEALFQQLNGVHSVVSGYSGGFVRNPSYRQVCAGATGHAEVIQITFDPKVISFSDLLEVFWKTHDPTTRDRQGNDAGPQYRSAIFYHTPEQKDLANHYMKRLNDSGAFAAPIVTEIAAFTEFYPAEVEHQNYYLDNPRKGYCRAIIRPKQEKFEEAFKDKLRPRTE